MALRSLTGKLKILTGWAAPPRVLASDLDKQCSKRIAGSLEEQAQAISERIKEADRRALEDFERFRKKNNKIRVLTVATGLGIVAFAGSCVVEAFADDATRGGEHSSSKNSHQV